MPRSTFFGDQVGKLRKRDGFSATGQIQLGTAQKVRFSVIWDNRGSDFTSIRTDKAPSKARGRENESTLRILVAPSALIASADQFEFDDQLFEVVNVFPRRELELGSVHHKQVDLQTWEGT